MLSRLVIAFLPRSKQGFSSKSLGAPIKNQKEETQAGIKMTGININNLRYADDTTLMAESKEELKSLLMKVKEKSKKLA